MTKKILFCVLLTFILSSCASYVGRYDANEFWGDAGAPFEECSRLSFYRYDGSTTEKAQITDNEKIFEIVERIRASKSKRLDGFSREDIEYPVLSLRFEPKPGRYMTAIFTNGIMITDEGSAYSFAGDIEGYFTEEMTECELRDIPALRLLAEDSSGWVAEYMPEATIKEKLEAPDYITATVVDYDNGSLTINFKNPGDTVWEFGNYADLHVLLDGTWRDIPTVEKWLSYFPGVGHETPAGGESVYSYHFESDLPSGAYRMVICGVTVEFFISYDPSGEIIIE